MVVNTFPSIVTLKLSGLNTPIKRPRMAEQIQKQDPYISYLKETHFRSKDTQTESEGMDKGIPCKWK